MVFNTKWNGEGSARLAPRVVMAIQAGGARAALVIWGQLLDDESSKPALVPIYIAVNCVRVITRYACRLCRSFVYIVRILFRFVSVGSRSLGTLFILSPCVH